MSRTTFHFISGLPRSGSTLLAAILRQNPVFHAAMSTPVAEIVTSVLRTLKSSNDLTSVMSDISRRDVLRGVIESYYHSLDRHTVIFDTNRLWCALLPLLSVLFPEARVIGCVRSPAWIIDSVERQMQSGAFASSRMFADDVAGCVYDRANAMVNGHFIGSSLKGLKQAWFGPHAGRLVVIRYESIASDPDRVVRRLYQFLNERPFTHDFNNLEYAAPHFDDAIGMPGFHNVRSAVTPTRRETILPPDLFAAHDVSFWEDPKQNPQRVALL